jgi:SAM-dependent methyltransferase
MTDVAAELRQRNKAVWGAGEWDDVANLVASVGPKVLDSVGIDPGMEVLDVGAGTGGNVAIPAALRGAQVVASDLVPDHFDTGRSRAAEAGVEIEWVEADAEALPFDDGSFDRVLSTFGHMFAPRHKRAGAELARVCRSGGAVGTATWRPTGFAGELFTTMGKHLPAAPDFAQPPGLWGDEGHAREMLEPHGLDLEFHHETVVFAHDGDADSFTTYYEEKFGPVVTAKAALGDDWPALRSDLVTLFEKWNQAGEGKLEVPSEYLLTIGRKRG